VLEGDAMTCFEKIECDRSPSRMKLGIALAHSFRFRTVEVLELQNFVMAFSLEVDFSFSYLQK
jgi:hypothetical protein